MLELYHADHSVCAQKVRIALAEKGLAWESRFLDLMKGEQHDPAYLKLNPGAVVPTLVHDGHVVTESTVINEYVDDAFEGPPLRPSDPTAIAHMRLWTKRLDEGLHVATGVVSHGIVFRHLKLKGRSMDEVLAELQTIPDPGRRERQIEAVTKGLDSRFFREAALRLDRVLADMEAALADGRPFLTGETYSLADAGLTPYVLRLDNMRFRQAAAERPHLAAWFDRMRERPSFRTAIRVWWNDAKVATMNEKGEGALLKLREVLGTA